MLIITSTVKTEHFALLTQVYKTVNTAGKSGARDNTDTIAHVVIVTVTIDIVIYAITNC